MASQQQPDEEELSEVNVIPLADLSLVLLIILMVLSPMIMQSMIKVHASRATAVSTQEDKPEPPLILLINPGGIFLNTVKMNTDLDLAAKLAQALGERREKTVMITADPAVSHGRVVSVLDIVKQQGAEKIAMIHKAGK